MNELPGELPIRRILFALDSAERGLFACAVAVRLAADLRVELRGLFVEDPDLLRASELPFAKEISRSGLSIRPITFETMERMLRGMADEVRAHLAELAEKENVPWSFAVRRAVFPSALLESVEQAELLLIGPSNAARTLGRALHAKRRIGPPPPLAVLFDGSGQSRRALETLVSLGRASRGEIAVLVVVAEPGRAAELQSQASALAAKTGPGRTFEFQAVKTIADVLAWSRRHAPQLILVGGNNPILTDAGLRLLIENLECPIGVIS